MSIHISCSECGAQNNGTAGMVHRGNCSAWNYVPRVGDYLRPPAQAITFDTPEEEAEWYRKLNGGSANDKPVDS